MTLTKQWLFCLFTFLCCLISSCQHTETETEKTERVADLECRAIALRKQRFALADSIRFTQDTLLHLKNNADSVRLSQKLLSFTGEKNTLVQSSLQLADTIRVALDSVRKYSFHTSLDRKQFDEKIKELLKEKGCSEE